MRERAERQLVVTDGDEDTYGSKTIGASMMSRGHGQRYNGHVSYEAGRVRKDDERA